MIHTFNKKASKRPLTLADLLVSTPHGIAVRLARWGNVVGLVLLAVLGWLWLVARYGGWQASCLVTTVVAVAGWIGPVRRAIQRRAWCVVTRNRLYTVFVEAHLHSRSGRLPVILRVRPTKVGERVRIWCPAGICIEEFESRTTALAAACFARDARVSADKRFAHLVTVEVIRRDTLAATETVAPSLLARIGARLAGRSSQPTSSGTRPLLTLVPASKEVHHP